MNGYIFTSFISAQAFQASIDQALGYPLAGVPCNDGLIAPAQDAITTHYTEIVTNYATGTSWAIMSDLNVDPVAAAQSLVSVFLDSTWFPSTVLN